MIVEVKWAEPKGQPEKLLLDLDEIAYCNRVTTGPYPSKVDFIHINLKNGSDLLLKDGEKLYNYIKDYNRIKVE